MIKNINMLLDDTPRHIVYYALVIAVASTPQSCLFLYSSIVTQAYGETRMASAAMAGAAGMLAGAIFTRAVGARLRGVSRRVMIVSMCAAASTQAAGLTAIAYASSMQGVWVLCGCAFVMSLASSSIAQVEPLYTNRFFPSEWYGSVFVAIATAVSCIKVFVAAAALLVPTMPAESADWRIVSYGCSGGVVLASAGLGTAAQRWSAATAIPTAGGDDCDGAICPRSKWYTTWYFSLVLVQGNLVLAMPMWTNEQLGWSPIASHALVLLYYTCTVCVLANSSHLINVRCAHCTAKRRRVCTVVSAISVWCFLLVSLGRVQLGDVLVRVLVATSVGALGASQGYLTHIAFTAWLVTFHNPHSQKAIVTIRFLIISMIISASSFPFRQKAPQLLWIVANSLYSVVAVAMVILENAVRGGGWGEGVVT